jgi:hypothetical protein
MLVVCSGSSRIIIIDLQPLSGVVNVCAKSRVIAIWDFLFGPQLLFQPPLASLKFKSGSTFSPLHFPFKNRGDEDEVCQILDM